LISFALVLVLGYAAIVAAMYFAQRTLLFPGASAGPMPAAPPWGEWVRIATPDGETLAALLSPAAPGKPTLLFFPGNGDNIVNLGFLARAFAAEGFGLLAVSYRGYPGSTGSPSETGLLIDGLAAFDWLAAHRAGPIVLLGQSLGTGVAVNTAAERNAAAAVVLVSPYLSVQSVAAGRYPFLPVSLLIKDSFRSDLRIRGVRQPKLFLHGDADVVIPLASGRALFAIATRPKVFSVQHKRGHNDIWSEAAIADIVAFATMVLNGQPVD